MAAVWKGPKLRAECVQPGCFRGKHDIACLDLTEATIDPFHLIPSRPDHYGPEWTLSSKLLIKRFAAIGIFDQHLLRFPFPKKLDNFRFECRV